MAELRVSELPTAVTLDDSDLLLLSQPDANSDTGYASAKTTNVALATKIAKNTSFGDLATTSKKLIGAINELKGEVGAQDLADLDDVNVTTPAAGECLQYNGTSQKWENKNILAVNETTLTEPYVYKQVPNGKYTEKLKKLIGASVVWNQVVENGNFANGTTGWTGARASISANNNVLTATCTTAGFVSIAQATNYKFEEKQNRVLLVSLKAKVSNISSTFDISISNVSINQNKTSIPKAELQVNAWKDIQFIVKPTDANAVQFRCGMNSQTIGDTIDLQNVNVTDLTAMFGSTIADYVNTLETAEAGSGIAWLKSYGFFTESYYAYSENTIQSVSVSGHKVVGFNQWDEEWEVGRYDDNGNPVDSNLNIRTKNPIRVFPNTQYCFYSQTGRISHVYWYDSEDTFIKSDSNQSQTGVLTSPSNAFYVRFRFPDSYGNIYQGGACLNISSTENGTYKPYHAETESLDHTTLRGLFKLDANNNLYADGDIYNADGSGSVKYGEVDLGTLDWTYDAQNNRFQTVDLTSTAKGNATTVLPNILCAKYTVFIASDTATTSLGITLFTSGNYVYVRVIDSNYTSKESFTTAMSGVYLVYELATPITATLTPFNPLSVIEQGGTEEFIDYGVQQSTRDVAIPCGNESAYGDNKLMGEIIKYINN